MISHNSRAPGLRALMLGAGLGVTLTAAPAGAQTAAPPAQTAARAVRQSEGTTVEQVVVTARRREERLINVPVAATALTATALNRYSIADLTSIGEQMPNVDLQQGGQGAGAFLAIRGIGSSPSETSTNSAVTIDVDGISTDRGRGIPGDIFDLSSAVVLKGPQALYYGKNSPAGVISLISNGPTQHWEGYAKVGYEFEAEEPYLEAAIGGPINDKLGMRLAFRGSDMFGGWVQDVGTPTPDAFHPGWTLPGRSHDTAPEAKDYGARLTLVWQPNSRFDATLKALAMHYHDVGLASLGEIARCAPGTTMAFDFGIGDPNSGCTLNGVNDHGDNPAERIAHWPNGSTFSYSQLTSAIGGLTLNYRFPKLTITSVTGIYWYGESNFDMSDPTVLAQYGGYDSEDFTSVSEELRLRTTFSGPLNFSVGGLLQKQHMSFRTSDAVFDIVPLGVGPDPVTGNLNNWMDGDVDKNHTESFFAEGTLDILPNLEIDGGARYTHEVKNSSDGSVFVNPNCCSPTSFFAFLQPDQRLIGQVAASVWNPQVTLTWHPSTNSTIYAAYRTGFKSGGIENPTVMPYGSTAEQFEYKPEEAEGGEVGAKGTFFNGRLTGDITIYRYDYSNLQVTVFDPSTISFLIKNAAKSRAQGVELQGSWQATSDLSFRTDIAYNDAKYLSYPGAACYALQTVGCDANGSQDLSGSPLQHAPLWSGSIGLTYEHSIGRGLTAQFTTDVRYSDGYQLGQGENYVQNPFTLVDAAVHLYTAGHVWEFALIGRNLGNVYYNVAYGVTTTPLGTPGQFSGQIARPRQVYLEATRKF